MNLTKLWVFKGLLKQIWGQESFPVNLLFDEKEHLPWW